MISGVRPSSGAETRGGPAAFGQSEPLEHADVAAAEDGRTPLNKYPASGGARGGFRGAGKRTPNPNHESGSVLIIVIWVAFGLVSIALYFAHSMSFELRSSDNRVAAVEAEQAIEGAARYVSNILANTITQQQQPGTMPDPLGYRSETVPVGDARFWLIGRDTNTWLNGPDRLTFEIGRAHV